ncbi:flagellar hook-basal body complex protein FliE [Flocculibacter collagenilyticus]|uniref:flagellar hook-basal body complex protein FliE n=1 Tax=Flocculibacter collagenilyticus TaxID=2744479 RepID=UPI0018F36B20|nr:flagellar hook-basal body complex protein FliE [Flocculibacter collagenilyticus]
MNLKADMLYAEMQSMRAQATNNPIETNKIPTQSSSADFGGLLKNAIDNVNGLQQDSKQKATAIEMGDRSVSLAEAMIASQKSSIAFEATVQVRNKLVESYKEIMNMPV